jgi:chaperonin cofactor prefoldin
LAIAYKQRKQARRKKKINTFYVEQEKVLDWAEQQWHKDEDGDYFKDIVDEEEPKMLKKAFRKYKKEKGIKKLEYNKENAKKVVAWMEEREPGFTEKFTTLKSILNSWVAENKIKT